MWNSVKFILLLALIIITIVTIDRKIENFPGWKKWFAAAGIVLALFLTTLVNGPPSVDNRLFFQQPSSDKAAGRPAAVKPDNSNFSAEENVPEQAVSQENNSQENNPQEDIIREILFTPVDEADGNPDFKAFRDRLLVAVREKDLEFLKKHVDQNIHYSFGESGGINGFLKYWNLNSNPEKSGFWSELEEVLKLGGTFDDKEKSSFTAPYVFSRFPGSYDAFEYAAVINKNVSIHAEPRSDSKIVGGLSYTVVKLEKDPVSTTSETTNGENFRWFTIRTLTGTEGYIYGKYLRSPLDYRTRFIKKDGVWKMTFFVAGD